MRDPSKVVWLSQTTLSVDETMETVARLKQRLPLLQSPPSDDICYATSEPPARGQGDRARVRRGDRGRLAQLVELGPPGRGRRSTPAPAPGYLVDYAHEIDDEWLDGATTVGLTSGASVPDELVMEVLDHLAERGFADVAEVTTAERAADLLAAAGAQARHEGRRGGPRLTRRERSAARRTSDRV